MRGCNGLAPDPPRHGNPAGARAGARHRPQRRAGRAARRRQDDAGAAGAARRSLAGRAGSILLLEPRRLAARAAARRMSQLLGEEPGATVGYAMRMESRDVGEDPHHGRHRGRAGAHDPRRSRTARRLGRAVRRVPRALARRRFRAGAGARRAGRAAARTCGCSSCRRRSTARACRSCLRRCACHRERRPQLSGRDPPRGTRAGYADRGRDGEGDPRGGGDRDRQRACLPARPARDRAHRRAPRRPAAGQLRHRPALWPARRQGAGCGDQAAAGRPPQGGARHLDRRDLDHHRRRARRHRFRPVAPAALRAGDRPDTAGDGACQPRLRRPARRPRRPHRARRRDQALARRADGGAAGLHAAGNPAGRSLRPAARLRGLRRRRPVDAALSSIRRPARRLPRRGRCSSASARSTKPAA